MTLQQLSNEERLRAGLDPLTARDLIIQAPQPTETMQAIGISKTNLDLPVRRWINRSFREPNGWPPLKKGALKPATTWSELLKKVDAA